MKYNSLFDLWEKVCNKYQDKAAFSDNKGCYEITYKQAFREVCFLAEKLKEYGIERYTHVSIFAQSSPRWLIIEQAIINLGGVIVAKSPEISLEELEFVYEQSDSSVVVTDNIEILNRFRNKNNLKFILYTGEDNIDNRKKEIYCLKDILQELNENTPLKTDWEDYPEDIAYISYTSGTSSQPKGAMLKNSSMAFVIEQLEKIKPAKQEETAISTCHISSMGWKAENLVYWALGCKTIYTHYKEFYETIEKYRPNYFEIPPKILQTIYLKLQENITQKGILFERFFKIAYYISKQLLYFERKCHYSYFIIRYINILFDKLIYKSIRQTMFSDNVLMDVGSAPLPKKLENFYQIIGVKLIQAYGATETTGIAISNTVESQKKHPYTVGIPFENITVKVVNPETFEELKKGETGLLLIKGPLILQGYYKNESAAEKALLPNGFYNTGDICYEDKDGYITILTRCDDVIVLTNGYNVYTRLLENEVKDSEYIKQIVIVGQGRPYLTAIVVVNQEKYKAEQGFKDFLIEHINEKIKRKDKYRYYEKIKDIYILNEDFTTENGLLAANTMKIKYCAVYNKYKQEIDKMYR